MSIQPVVSPPAGTQPGGLQPTPATAAPAHASSTAPAAGRPPVQSTGAIPARIPSAQELQNAMKEVEKAVAPMAQELQFSIDKDTNKTVVKIMDTATNKVVRQIPSEEVMELAKSIGEMQDRMQGLLVQQKA